MKPVPSVPLEMQTYPQPQMRQRAADFFNLMQQRHSTRDFADKPVPLDVIMKCLETAGRAPSGANQQPWHFVVVTAIHKPSTKFAWPLKKKSALFTQNAPLKSG
ncbi:MAG: nitroreductase family protein [Candidatus Promineifilaceae bacterium]